MRLGSNRKYQPVPSLFRHLMRRHGAPLMRHAMAERDERGRVDLTAVDYVDPRGARRRLAVALGPERVVEAFESEQGDVETYTTKQRTRTLRLWHGAEAGRLPGRVELEGVFEFTAEEPAEAWAVEEVTAADSAATRLVIVFTQEINRGRSGVQ